MALENVGKTLEISKAHLRAQDVVALEGYDGDWFEDASQTLKVHHEQEANWISTGALYVTGKDQEDVVARLKEEGFSDEFINIMTTAVDEDIRMVIFDVDADFEPGFPIFDDKDNDV